MLQDHFAGVPEFPLARCREVLTRRELDVESAVIGVQEIWREFADKWGHYGAFAWLAGVVRATAHTDRILLTPAFITFRCTSSPERSPVSLQCTHRLVRASFDRREGRASELPVVPQRSFDRVGNAAVPVHIAQHSAAQRWELLLRDQQLEGIYHDHRDASEGSR